MTQIKAHLMKKKHYNWLFPGNSAWFSWLNKDTLWSSRYLEAFFPQITKNNLNIERKHATQLLGEDLCTAHSPFT